MVLVAQYPASSNHLDRRRMWPSLNYPEGVARHWGPFNPSGPLYNRRRVAISTAGTAIDQFK